MGYNTGMVKYFIGVLLLNAFPMYVFGSGILTGWQFIERKEERNWLVAPF